MQPAPQLSSISPEEQLSRMPHGASQAEIAPPQSCSSVILSHPTPELATSQCSMSCLKHCVILTCSPAVPPQSWPHSS